MIIRLVAVHLACIWLALFVLACAHNPFDAVCAKSVTEVSPLFQQDGTVEWAPVTRCTEWTYPDAGK